MKNINNISPDKADFTQRLLAIAKPPKSLWFMGEIPENAPSVAIVGSRKPSEYGKYITEKIASQLAARGVIVVSGLALGHDALAHQSALKAGGTTVAVLCDLENITPRSNIGLAQQIIQQNGALISENHPGIDIKPWMFLARNRLVAGLADVVIVVEASAKSGTLNTAMHALEQGKEIMAIPGNITSPLSVGCNRLIAQGATPLLSVDDVFEKLGISSLDINSSPTLVSDATQQKIIDLLQSGTFDGDVIAQKLQLEITTFNQAITMLEISGVVKSLGANKWILK